MQFQVITELGESLELYTALPEQLKNYKIFSSVNAFLPVFGVIAFQSFTGNGFTILYNDYLIKSDASFYKRSASPLLILHLAYQNHFNFDVEGLGKLKFKESQFNLTYLPFVNAKFTLAKGEHTSFCIGYTKEYLSKFSSYLPSLEKFLENVENNKPCLLSKSNLYASDKMIGVMKDILEAEDEKELNEFFIEGKARELLVLAMRRMKKISGDSMRKNDIERIETIHAWINDNESNYGSLRSVAQRFGLNVNKLNKGFKQLYGLTVFDYVLKLRMEKASQFLKETDMPIAEISFELGYTRVSAFTRAFKKFFAYNPNMLRKNK
jgi:AraC family transcriptional activator of pyochelin receptor